MYDDDGGVSLQHTIPGISTILMRNALLKGGRESCRESASLCFGELGRMESRLHDNEKMIPRCFKPMWSISTCNSDFS